MAFAALAVSLVSAPVAAQGEFRYADIPWGIDAKAATNALTAQGFELSGGTPSQPGDLVFADVDGVIAVALFAGDTLVGIGIAYVASRELIAETFEGSVADAVRNLGEPAERAGDAVTWRRAGTSFSIMTGESESGVVSITAQYGGPGYDEEVARRAAQAPPRAVIEGETASARSGVAPRRHSPAHPPVGGTQRAGEIAHSGDQILRSAGADGSRRGVESSAPASAQNDSGGQVRSTETRRRAPSRAVILSVAPAGTSL